MSAELVSGQGRELKSEEQWFQISALSHYAYCSRRFALVHIENQWSENVHTVSGSQAHERVHDPDCNSTRPNKFTRNAMRVFSPELGVSGECDVVEFIRSDSGISMPGRPGLWTVCPVEYKYGGPSSMQPESDPNALQLCCQAMCLEHMLLCDILYGYLYHISVRRRVRVMFTDALRDRVSCCLSDMHALYDRKHTPAVKYKKRCRECSLYDICLPELFSKQSVQSYIAKNLSASDR